MKERFILNGSGGNRERKSQRGWVTGAQKVLAQDQMLGPYPEATVFQSVAGVAPVTSEDTQRDIF